MNSSVYFILAGEHIKIGYSRDPFSRFENMRVGCPLHMELLGIIPGGREVERRWHQQWKDQRVRGEWFYACVPLIEAIRAASAKYHQGCIFDKGRFGERLTSEHLTDIIEGKNEVARYSSMTGAVSARK